jgi:hypothetical protein
MCLIKILVAIKKNVRNDRNEESNVSHFYDMFDAGDNF